MTARVLPGIAFRTEPPAQVGLPRMDIAAFVGFAQRGPLDTPVVVESAKDFADIFGRAVRLARDEVNGIEQTACLAPAVDAFFAQGGRRCWVVRVAARPTADQGVETSRFYLPGLLQVQPGGYGSVALPARSPGSWADDLEAGAELLVTPLMCEPQTVEPGAVSLMVGLPMLPLAVGDLLQLESRDEGGTANHRGYGVVESIAAAGNGLSQISLGTVHWFRRVAVADLVAAGDRSGDATFQDQTRAAILLDELQEEEGPDFTRIRLHAPFAAAAGDWLRFASDGDTVWLRVTQDSRESLILGPEAWQEGSDGSPRPLAQVHRLRLALRARGLETSHTLEDLTCSPTHPRFLGYLPSDATLFDLRWGKPSLAEDAPSQRLRTQARSPRFPLAAELTTVLIPLGVETAAAWRGAVHSDRRPLERDGLVPATADPAGLTGLDWSAFWPQLYLDAALGQVRQRSLLREAEDRLYLQGLPLLGIYSLLPIAEVSMVALPDAPHSGWRLTQRQRLAAEPESGGLLLWLLLVVFDCGSGSDFIAKGPLTPGLFLLRVLLLTGSGQGTRATVAPGTDWTLLPEVEYVADGLLDIHSAAARLAAALGDRVAVLGLPKHYRAEAVRPYQQRLLGELQRSGEDTASYVALYHPWLIGRSESGALVHSSPVGAVCGVMGDLSRRRGAWVAPANAVLTGVLGTIPALFEADELGLYQASINPIRYAGLQAVIWGAFTQSPSAQLEDLNVRRLLILLKRLAASVGQEYLFAAHSGALRRRVKRQFEQLLGRLFTLGALAGEVPTQAFQVGIDASVNTASSIEQGRFIVELRVAPSRPLTFITVRLVQQEQAALITQEILTNGR